jgi:phage gpG-like protein
MSKSKLAFKVDNSDLKRFTGKVTDRLRDLRAPLTAAGNLIEAKVERQFATETDPDGDRWEELHPTTLKQKEGGSILVKTGALRDSFTFVVNGKTLEVGSTSPVFEVHNEGVLPMPERRILGLNPEDKNEIAGLVRGYVKGSR